MSVDVDTLNGAGGYIRVRAVATQDVVYDVSAGFQFMHDTATGTFQKVVRQERRSEPSTGAESAAVLRLSIVPNPMRDGGRLMIDLAGSGSVELSLYDMMGRLVQALPVLEATDPGEYALDLDTRGLRPGTYVIHARQSGAAATVRFTVVR